MFNNDTKIKKIHEERRQILDTRKSPEYREINKQYRRNKKASNKKVKKGDYRSSSDSEDSSYSSDSFE